MKNTLLALLGFFLLTTPLAATAQEYNGFIYGVWPDGFSRQIIITGYTGFGGDVDIPGSINGWPVKLIGNSAFDGHEDITSVTIPYSVTSIGSSAFHGTSLTSVTIPSSVTSIGAAAFADCTSLAAITVDPNNSVYSSVDGVLFDKGQTKLIQYPVGKSGSYTIPNSVTSIGDFAFAGSIRLTSITIPSSVAYIGNSAFAYCTSLTRVYFQGNAPSLGGFYVFYNDPIATVYYLLGTTGWGATYDGLPTALWLPQVKSGDASFGVQTNQFGFNITWASGRVVVVEASTDQGNPVWSPVATNTLTGDTSYFSDPQWTNYPARFYRVRSP